MSLALPSLPVRLVTSKYTVFFCAGFLLMAAAVVISKVQRKPSAWRVKAVLLAMTSAAAPAPPPQPNSPLIVGIFREDGFIVPFAQYASRKWSNPWGLTRTTEPQTVADLPYPWYLAQTQLLHAWPLLVSSTAVQSVMPAKSVQVCSHCQQVWGLPTDYPNAQAPEPNSCTSNLGIALSRNVTGQVINLVKNEDADWMRVTKFVAGRFDQAEAAGLRKVISPQYLAQIPPQAQRKKVPLKLLHLYRAQLARGQTIFFFEVSKEYSGAVNPGDPGCHPISLLAGWIVQEDGQLTLVKTDFSPTDCDGKEGGTSRPYAILQLDGKQFAVVEEDSYEGESYVIFQIHPRGLRRVLETYAGSC